MIRRLVLGGVAAAAAYGVARGVGRLLATRATPALRARMDRTNHAGRTVSLSEGPATVAGLLAPAVLVPGTRARTAVALVTAVSGVLGAVDDFGESGDAKGLRGHLGALASGHVTTGGLKVLGIPAVSLLAAGFLGGRGDSVPTRALDLVAGGGVIAGTANLLNLLDLRPGRALKATLVLLVLTGGRNAPGGPHGAETSAVLTGALLGTVAALVPDDLAGATMLGDTGANALGAVLGTRLALDSDTRGRLLALGVLAGLTLASEKVSFTRVIENTPGLRELDAWGR
ncbi:hypothetical protein [Brevibacterium litoralis]|uniref:hypothetical protein n=1 Tax=Brevibacterium litoralis TaxID=3138935 RepID=UPI0032EB83E3